MPASAGSPTTSSSSRTREATIAFAVPGWCTRTGSPTRRSTEWRGFSDEYGSWKIICILVRSGRSSLSGKVVISVPSKRMRPDVGS